MHPEKQGHGAAGVPADPRLIEESWTSVAPGYKEYWTPRFRPYVERALELFRSAPQGPLAVPGCGPGEEVFLLAARHPDRSIIATDPSLGMMSLVWAGMREKGTSNVVASIGSAENLSAFVRQAAGILSCFTLQLLPNPLAALADWSRALRAGGSIAALFWPRQDDAGPAGELQSVIEAETGEGRIHWEDPTLEALPRIGLRLTLDERIEREMEHASPGEYFDELVRSGPLQPFERRLGREAIERCKAAWLARHGLEKSSGGWRHSPAARAWVLERIEGFEPEH